MNLDGQVKNRFSISEMLKLLFKEINILKKNNGTSGGVQTVTGPGINNTDPANPVVKTASSTSEGVVDLVSNQQLGAGDKRINGKRIGTGGGNISSNTVVGGGLSSNSIGSNDTSVGAFSLFSNTTGSNNTAIGVSALQTNSTASGSTAVGNGAGYYSNGAKNTFIGVSAGQGDSTYTGANNTAIGYAVGNKLSSGSNNTLVGSETGTITEGVTTGSNNTIIGKTATGVTTGSGNTLIGRITGLVAALTNNVVIADGAGNIAIQKSATHELTAPLVTNALITSAGNKALVTKEYVESLIPKEYVALISQTGTNAPTVIVLKNTLGSIPTFNYEGVGQYSINLNGGFLTDKTWSIIGSNNIGTQDKLEIYDNGNDSLWIDSVGSDDKLTKTPIRVEIYP